MRMFLKHALALLPLAILGSCASDDMLVDSNNDHIADKSELRYLQVAICNPGSGTRATPNLTDTDDPSDYQAGTPDENEVKTIDFYFYDDRKNYLSHTALAAGESGGVQFQADGDNLPIDTEITDFVESLYHCNVPVQLVEGDRLPAYVLCIVNGVNPNAYEEKPMEEAQKTLLYGIYDITEKKYFGMNNSVYYGTDDITGKSDQLIMATPFNPDLLKTASEVAENSQSNAQNARLNIYVERYAAKVNLNVATGAAQEIAAGNAVANVTLKFVPEMWGLNAYEQSFYLIKGYRQLDDPTVFADINTLNSELFAGWNRPDDFRSFWARTPAFFMNEYPVVADDILDHMEGVKYNPNNVNMGQLQNYRYPVFYSSINSMKGNAIAEGETKSQYAMETTLKQSRLNGEGMPAQYLPINSIPAVVLAGRYTVTVGTQVFDNTTFYVYGEDSNGRPGVLAEEEEALGDIPTIKKILLDRQNIVLKKGADGIFTPLSWDTSDYNLRRLFVVDHPDESVRNHGSLKVSGDVVTLQMKNVGDQELYYFSPRANAEGYVRITEANLDEVNKSLYQNLGGAKKFFQGKGYYTAPIIHWGWYRADNVAEPQRDASGNIIAWGGGNNGRPVYDWDWSKMKAGDFGIVRNHAYTINISKIAGLGTGVRDFDHPLLPPADKIGYNVHFDVNIQKWGLLPEQNWEW